MTLKNKIRKEQCLPDEPPNIFQAHQQCFTLFTPSMTLSPKRSRAFVIAMVAIMIGLAILATVLITRGMNDEQLQEQLRQLEGTRGG